MSNAIINRVVEALEARGFSNSEAVQMVHRVRSGKGELPLIPVEKISEQERLKIFAQGFEAGKNFEKQEQLKRGFAMAQQMQAASQKHFGYSQYSGGLGGMCSGLFGVL